MATSFLSSRVLPGEVLFWLGSSAATILRRRGISLAAARRRSVNWPPPQASSSPPVIRENRSDATQEARQSLLVLVSMRSASRGRAIACHREPGCRRPQAEAAVKPVEVVRTNDYTEGVVVDHEGNLYFSHEKIVTKVTPDGKASTWAQTGSPNGHKILADGTHLICDASRHALLHLAADGTELKPAATESDGEPLRGPNDLTLDTPPAAFTSPIRPAPTTRTRTARVHYLDSDGIATRSPGAWPSPTGS